MQLKDYYNKGYQLADSSKYGWGIGGKIRAYEENIGKVANASPEWEQFLCGWDNYINDVCLKAKQDSPGASYGFNSDEIGDAKIAYEIQGVFRQYLAVKRNDGYFDYSGVDFRDPLKASEEPLPEIVNFVKYIDHLFTPAQSKKINLHNKKKYKEAWDYIDSLKLDLPSGEGVELISGLNGVTMRIHKPRKEKR